MNKVQIAVLGATVVALGGAYVLFNSAPAPAPQQRVAQAPKLETDEVLIAAQDLPMGTAIADGSISWVIWPKAAISDLMIVKSSDPAAIDEIKGSLTRDAFIRGDPVRRDKLVKGGAGGFMSAILPSGMRAIAIKIDNTGNDNAGGFILPNDRVDVIKIFRDDQATKDRGVEVLGAQAILTNVKVLAIGQNVQEENGKKVVSGGNATLELDPQQTEQVILAERAGNANLHLALRSLVDSAGPPQTVGDDQGNSESSLTIVRFGAPQTAAR
jgi:pilus assembly protein CpaB